MSQRAGNPDHLAYLDAMGIQVWQRRQIPPEEMVVESSVAEEVEAGVQAEALPAPQVELQEYSASEALSPSAPSPAPAEQQPVTKVADAGDPLLDWSALAAHVATCTKCELYKERTQAVFGVGNQNADWMIIGEGPGADEDAQGEPFVGRAGQLLNLMLEAVGLKRQAVYIANIVKCRPPNNRDPRPEEAAACESYLLNQIALVKPKIILTVGRVAAQNLLKTDQRIGALRGKRFEYGDTGIPVVATYHPAYLLRSPGEKRKAWEDLLLARRILESSR